MNPRLCNTKKILSFCFPCVCHKTVLYWRDVITEKIANAPYHKSIFLKSQHADLFDSLFWCPGYSSKEIFGLLPIAAQWQIELLLYQVQRTLSKCQTIHSQVTKSNYHV